MKSALWQIVLKETFLSPDLIILLTVPLLAFVIMILIYKKQPLKTAEAWYNVGKRFAMLGWVFAAVTLLLYIGSILFANSHKNRDNTLYTATLQVKFREYYGTTKNYTQRMIDFAQRIEDTKDILAEMNNFATNLPVKEREKFGRAWAASLHGGSVVRAGNTFNKIEEMLYWTDERLAQYAKKHPGMRPAGSELRYSKQQIAEFKKNNWAKLYPMLEPEQWIFIKNQILNINSRDQVLGFLRDVADTFQMPDPTESLNKLYDHLADKACPTEMQKIECYLENMPKLLHFYKFSLLNRWWFRMVPVTLLYLLIGIWIILSGRAIALDGKKKKLFK